MVASAIGAPNVAEFRVLGSLEVVDQDGQLALGAPKQRALLAVLLVRRGEAVSSDRLIDEIWGERPPASANKIVQGYVSNLRKALGDGLLLTERRGYVLRLEPGRLDVDRFETLVARGRAALEGGDPLTAAAVLREALALWRGPALADFAYEPFAQPEIARLEESRLDALEDRIDADLASGQHARLVGELEALVREHPLRERVRGQLMVALYRSGRQADALQAYRDARRELLDGLGLEPGRVLQELERAILAHDPGLDLPAGRTARPSPAAARNRRRSAALITAAAALLLLATIAAVAVQLAGSGSSIVRVAPNSVAAIDIGSDRVVDAIPVGDQPGAIAFGSGTLWVANLGDKTISRVDPNNRRTLPMIPVAGPPAGIAAGPRGLWVVDSPGTSSVLVGRVDPVFNTFGSVARIGNVDSTGAVAIATQGNSVWVAPSAGELTRLDGTTGKRVQLDPNASPAGIAIGEGAIWLTDPEAGNVVRVDRSGLLTAIPVGNTPTGVAVGGGGVWVADSLDDAVVRIDPDTRSVTATIPVGRSPAGVAYGAGSVWVADSGDGTVTRIDPHADKVQATITVGGSPQAITIADGKAWVTVDEQSIPPSRGAPDGGTLRIVSSSDVPSLDPANPDPGLSARFLYATCAQLLNYPDKAGPAGSQLTPEVAQSLPARSPDGKTYAFKIRPGFRFSPPSNEPVTAQTFKDTIERTLNPRMHSYYAHWLGDIVGAGAYMSGKASQIAGVITNGDTLTIRLLAPAPDFLARLSQPPGSCAVPSDTPVTRNGVNPLPSAGPYYVTSYTKRQGVVLMRNRNYHGRRPHHFARIVLAVGVSPKRAVSKIEAGLADYTPVGFEASAGAASAAHLSQLAARYGAGSPAAARGARQYFANPAPQLDYFVLNTHRPLFSDVRMRQAVNYALNRRALAQLGDAFTPVPAQPANHYLPPGMPGFRNAHVYPMTPNVVKARKLARGGGRTAVLYTCDVSPCREQAQIVKTDLAAIGLQVHITTVPFAKYFTKLSNPGEPFDLAWGAWEPEYIDPAGMLNPILEDGSNGPTFDDPAYRRRLAAAGRLTGPERYLTYGQLDLNLARNAAPLAAFDNLTEHDLYSARIGCQTFGIYGMDLAALCIKRTHRPSSRHG